MVVGSWSRFSGYGSGGHVLMGPGTAPHGVPG